MSFLAFQSCPQNLTCLLLTCFSAFKLDTVFHHCFQIFQILPADPPCVDLLVLRPNQKLTLSNIYHTLMATESDSSSKIQTAWD